MYFPADSSIAPAQGIIAQVRILGGSLGIAASTAILGTKTREQLSGLSPTTLSPPIHGDITNMVSAEAQSVRQAYGHAFREDMRMCLAVTAAAVVLTGLAFRRRRLTLAEMRKLQIEEEVRRRRALAVTVQGAQVNRAQ
jgi:hypothetical protein